jgi:hypothetical protein
VGLQVIDVVVAVNDDAVLGANLMRSPLINEPGVCVHLQRGYASASSAFCAAMAQCQHDVVVFVHQDVYLPKPWGAQLMRSVQALSTSDPAWAVLGVYGSQPNGKQVGCVWSSGLQAVFGAPFEQPRAVHSIDEVLIVLRRSSGVTFDPALPGYHLYATDLVQTALSRGLGAYVISAPVVHNSRPVLYLAADYFKAYAYVCGKWQHRLPIYNNVARLTRRGPAYWRLRARHWLNEKRFLHHDRKALARGHDCVEVSRRLGFE